MLLSQNPFDLAGLRAASAWHTQHVREDMMQRLLCWVFGMTVRVAGGS
jgi:hypothetical protein